MKKRHMHSISGENYSSPIARALEQEELAKRVTGAKKFYGEGRCPECGGAISLVKFQKYSCPKCGYVIKD
jgi:ssDNA-binding Zn-finger/Zn-ribbon topoisomerase 1